MTHLARWRDQPLVLQFLLAGGAVMLAAMLVIGAWITGRIEDSVVANTASAGALYLESFVSPLSQELAANDRLSEPAVRALDEVFADDRHRQAHRLVQDLEAGRPGRPCLEPGADRPALHRPSRRCRPPGPARSPAASTSSTTPRTPPRPRSASRSSRSIRRCTRSGRARSSRSPSSTRSRPTSQHDLADARRKSWLLVAGVFLASGLMLLGIVRAGGRTIARQKAQLEASREPQSPRTPSSANAPSAPPPAPPPRPSAACAGSAPTCTTARRNMSRSPRCASTAWCPRPKPAGRRRRRCARRCRPRSPRSAPSRAGSPCPSSTGCPSPRSRAARSMPTCARQAGRSR